MNIVFSKGYVDSVVDMRIERQEVKRFLLNQLDGAKDNIDPTHYEEMRKYIKAK